MNETAQFDAMRDKVPSIAPRIFDMLRSAGWRGWKPESIAKVEDDLYEKLSDLQDNSGFTAISSGGIKVSREDRGEEGAVVIVAFDCTWEAYDNGRVI